MNWYKYCRDFSERNVINNKMTYLGSLREILLKIAKVVFQSGSIAKKTNLDIVHSKKISSYPNLRDILIDADNVALDSPWKFALFCQEAITKIDILTSDLKSDRDRITYNQQDKKKGWV